MLWGTGSGYYLRHFDGNATLLHALLTQGQQQQHVIIDAVPDKNKEYMQSMLSIGLDSSGQQAKQNLCDLF